MGGQTFDCQPIRPCRILLTPLDPTRRPKLMTNRLFKTCSAWCAVAALALVAPVDAAAQVDLEALQDEAVAWLQEYIGINTINPPGNETRGAEFFAEIFEAEGIEYEMAESAPGRGNIWARLDGGDEEALVLIHHMDVVPADERFWTTDPLSGELRDGYIYGRGALDTKTGGILHLATFLALHRSGIPLKRDVMFVATADEEAGGFFGAGWLVENRPEIFEGVGFLLNEGGGGGVVDGKVQFGVEVTQKVPYWLRLTTVANPGHGSSPQVTYAAVEMVAALERLRLHEFEARIIPAVDVHFKGSAGDHPEPWRSRFADIATAIEQPGVLRELQAYQPWMHTLTRNTCSITRFEGSSKINVVSPEVWAEIDCRLLPDQDPDAWLAEMGGVLGPDVEIEVLMGFSPAVSSTDTELYRTVQDVTLETFPGANFVPQVSGGFTDSHFFRDLGIVSYGYEATATPEADGAGVHGNDERVTEENVRRGVAMTLKILERFAATRPIMEEY
jgi:acetylornithine deacetylase/succinyl-diaminopimelate desuccinylase-like protein